MYLAMYDDDRQDFNSHTREGVTIFLLLISYGIYISTHTPVRV